MPAPMANECAPHKGGAMAVPSPTLPWQRSQLLHEDRLSRCRIALARRQAPVAQPRRARAVRQAGRKKRHVGHDVVHVASVLRQRLSVHAAPHAFVDAILDPDHAPGARVVLREAGERSHPRARGGARARLAVAVRARQTVAHVRRAANRAWPRGSPVRGESTRPSGPRESASPTARRSRARRQRSPPRGLRAPWPAGRRALRERRPRCGRRSGCGSVHGRRICQPSSCLVAMYHIAPLTGVTVGSRSASFTPSRSIA